MPTFDELWTEVEEEQKAGSNFDSLWNEVKTEDEQQTAADVRRFGVEQPMQAVSALQSALPIGLSVQNRLQKKEALQEEADLARAEGEAGGIGLKAIELAQRTLEPLTPSGLMNQPARLIGRPDVYQAGQPLIQIPRNPNLEGTVAGGIANIALGAVESMTTPEMIVTAPGLAGSALARGAMAFDMARHIPEQVAQSAETLATPESTAQEKVEAIGAPLMSAFFAGALARGHVAKPKEIPLQTGKALEVPEGARVPRIEPPPGIQRATPAEAAQAAELMQRTATTSFEQRHRNWPRPGLVVPEKTGPQPQERVARQRPVVPEGPAEEIAPPVPEAQQAPREIATWDDAVTAIRERAKGTETKEQIQALLPEIKLSREAAGNLAIDAFGENWKPGGQARAPGPKPVEGLTPEQQAILAKGRTTTMSAEERALAERMMSGELDRPSEAPQATVVERPSETREVQRQGQEEGREEIAPIEPAPVEQPSPAPAPSPMPEAPAVPKPVQPKPTESAKQFAKESGLTFDGLEQWGVKPGGKGMTPEMEAAFPKQWAFTWRREDVSHPGLTFYVKEGASLQEIRNAFDAKKRAFDEGKAIREAQEKAEKERKPDVAQGEGRLPSGEPPNREELRNVPEQGKGPGPAEANQPVQETVEPKPETIQPKVETAKPPVIESEQAKPVGVGGAVPSEFERTKGSPMSMRVEEINRARIARGEQPLLKPETVHDQDVLNRAMAEFDRNPAYGEQLVDRINTQGGALSDVETHALLIERINVWEERNKAAARARQAYEDSKQFPNRLADMAAENAQTQYWADRLDAIERASRASAREKGLALRAQRIMLNQDFTLAAMEQRALQARGFRELPPEQAAKEKAELTKLADEYKAKSDALQKRIDELEAEAAVEAAKQKATEEPAYHPRVLEMAENYAKRWDERGKQALTDLKALFGGGGEGKLFSGVPIGPEVLDKLAIYGISKMVRGAVDFAKWTDAMVKDIGEGFRQHAKTVWDEANARLDKDLAASESKFGRDAKAVKSAVKSGATTPAVTPESLVIKMRSKRAKDPRANISTLARKLARLYIERGVKDRELLLDQVHEDLRKVEPSITRRGTMDVLSGYGDYSRLPQDEVSKVLRDLQGQMQQIAKLEDMAAGKAPSRTGRERRIPSDIERRLSQQVEEAKRKGGYKVTDPERQLRTALDAVKKRLENQISDLETQIQTRTKIVREKTPIQEDAATAELRRRRDELKAQYDEIFAKPELTDAERLEAWKERTRDRIEEATEILAGTRQRRARKAAIDLDHEALRLRYDLHQIERQIREREVAEKMKNRPTYQKVIGEIGEAANTVRALMTSFDFSAPLRQGLIIGAAHPMRAAQAFPEMFRAAFSPEQAFRQAEALRNRENAPLYESSGLYLAEHGGRLSAMEEAFMSRRAEELPLVGRGIRASQRAYTAYLNRIRADSFDSMVKGLTQDGKGNPAELKAIANFINVATGRGSVAWNQAATTLNTVFFAPRYVASRFEFLAGQPLYKGTARTRKLIAKEYGRFLAGAAVVYALAQAAGGKVGTDPNSADFGKIQVGDTRIDPMAGLLQSTVLASRTASIYGSKAGLMKAPEQKGRKLEMSKVLWNFLRGKLAPVPGLVLSFGEGKYPGGKKVTPANVATSVLPISWQDIYEATKAQGVPAGLALGVLSIFGTGVQTYEK